MPNVKDKPIPDTSQAVDWEENGEVFTDSQGNKYRLTDDFNIVPVNKVPKDLQVGG